MTQHPMAMHGMGVGGPVAAPANAGTPTSTVTGWGPGDVMKKLNTAIYDYLLCHEKYDAARAIKDCLTIEFAEGVKQSPGQRQNQPNGVDSSMDVDSKDHIGIQKRPTDLPAPNSLSTEEGPFLQDWWCQFWELYQGNRQRGKQTTLSYVGQQRALSKTRTGIMGNMDPNGVQRGYNNMMANGAMGGDFRQAALKNGMTPQQQHQMAQLNKMRQGQNNQMQGAQMERQGSQMDANGPRSGSPNTGTDAPSSPKRPRLDGGGNMQQMNQARPGQPGQMPGGNQGMPPNPAMGPGAAQSSPMNQQGLDGTSSEYYPPNRMSMPQNGAAVAAASQQANTGNHALQDYQMQLMLLEQQNKKRLLMARQEQDNIPHSTGVPGPNGGQFAPGRGSPTPGMMDPHAVNPAMRPQMVMGPNGQMMRPPSSHPIGQISQQQQMEIMQRNGQMMPNGNWPGGPQPQQVQMMQGQPPQQGGPPAQPPNMTPRQGNMPPPPAPAANPGGTQPSSPANQPAPPTPNQANKPKPPPKKAAEKKNTNKKGTGGGTANEETNAPPTPTPPPPVTPNNATSFNQNKNLQMPNGQPGPGQQPNQNTNNGQQSGAPPVQQGVPDMNSAPFGDLGGSEQFGMDFANIDSGDVLDNFDFDSFLNSTGDDQNFGFDATMSFDNDGAIDMGAN